MYGLLEPYYTITHRLVVKSVWNSIIFFYEIIPDTKKK